MFILEIKVKPTTVEEKLLFTENPFFEINEFPWKFGLQIHCGFFLFEDHRQFHVPIFLFLKITMVPWNGTANLRCGSTAIAALCKLKM